jgi:hypothetical protein
LHVEHVANYNEPKWLIKFSFARGDKQQAGLGKTFARCRPKLRAFNALLPPYSGRLDHTEAAASMTRAADVWISPALGTLIFLKYCTCYPAHLLKTAW